MIRTPRRALWALIAITFGLRMVWASLLPAGHDEAYHYSYAVHPDWSYFDHPPMTMLIEQVGLVLGGGFTRLSLRLGFILLFAGSTWLMFRWTARWYGDWPGFYAALALNFAGYFTAAAGALALPDGPLLFFVLLTLWALSEAVVERVSPDGPAQGSFATWGLVGLAWAGALVSKYHAIFLPAGAVLYLLVTPAARRCLRTPGPYLASAVGLCGFLPVVIWNVQHDWASFAFQAGRAAEWQFGPEGLLATLGGPLMYLFPWIWLALVLVLMRFLKAGKALQGVERFLLCQSVVPIVFFLGLSLASVPLPHWSLIGFVPLFPALGLRWAEAMSTAPIRTRCWLAGCGIGSVVVATALILQTWLGLVPLDRDPALEMRDWSPLVQELERRGLVGLPNTFWFTRCWHESGHLAYALGNRATVLCYDRDARGFAYWSRPTDWLGQDGILVSHDKNRTEEDHFRRYFRRIDLVAQIPMMRNGCTICTARVFRCSEQIKPFPFRPEPKQVEAAENGLAKF